MLKKIFIAREKGAATLDQVWVFECRHVSTSATGDDGIDKDTTPWGSKEVATGGDRWRGRMTVFEERLRAAALRRETQMGKLIRIMTVHRHRA